MRKLVGFHTALFGGLCFLAIAATASAQDIPFQTGQSFTFDQLVPLPAGPEDMLFSGETDKHTMLFVAQPSHLAGAANFYLTVQSAISVAPEWSQLSVAINDQIIGSSALKAGEAYSLKWSVPAGLLQPGYNAVTFAVDQAHRVDCSIDATYELWTRIDPTQSGFAFQAAQQTAPDYTSILAAVGTANGATSLHGVIEGGEGKGTDALVAVFQTLAIGASIDRPAADFSIAAGTGPGIDVIVGGWADLSRRLAVTGTEMAIAQGVNIGRRADGRVIVAILAETDSELSSALVNLADGLRQASIGTPSGLAALERLKGVPVVGDGHLSFAQLGVYGDDFGGRVFAQAVNFRLPTDFYPADYAQAAINLDALYSSGLAPGASVQFKVNDRIVSTLNLSGSRTGEASDRRLPIELSAFRPGLNELKIEAMLPARLDNECAPGTTANNGRRFQLAGTSMLELPTLARIGRFPDLGALETSITGRDNSAELTVVTAGTGTSDASVAATFLTRLAYSSGRIIPVNFSTTMSLDQKDPQLVVAASGQLPLDIRQNLPVDLAATPVAPAYEFAAALPVAGQQTPVISDGISLPSLDVLTADARAVLNDLMSDLYGLGMSAGVPIDALRRQAGTGQPPVLRTDLLIAQTLNRTGTAPVTILTAATGKQLVDAMPNFIAGGWVKLNGSAIALAASGEKLQQVKAMDVQYFPAAETSLDNIRLVAAGWLSNAPSLYVVLMLISALLLGILTQVLVVRTRRKL